MTAHIQEDFAPNEDDLEVERVEENENKRLTKQNNFRSNPSPKSGCLAAVGQHQSQSQTLSTNS